MKAAVKRLLVASLWPVITRWRYVSHNVAEILGAINEVRQQLNESQARAEALRSQLAQLHHNWDQSHKSIMALTGNVRTSHFHNSIVSPVYGGESARVLEAMRLLAPHDVSNRQFRRVGREFDGGYVMIDDFSMVKEVVSCGIEGEVSWDRNIADLGFRVRQYDHTIERSPEPNSLFKFHKLAIRPSEGEDGITLKRIVSDLGEKAKGAILKLDIERSEWGVLATVDDETLASFSQMVVEFHDLHYLPLFIEQAEAALQRLSRLFFVAHVHANNHEEVYSIGGIIVPRVLEVTFASRAWFEPAPLTRSFPTPLDRRNDPRRPEIHLGKFAY